MKTFHLWTILCVIGVGSAGCSTVNVRLDSYKPEPPSYQKIPLKVAVVVDRKTKPHPIEFNQIMYNVTVNVDMEPGFSNAIKAELESIFQEATMVEDSRQAKESDLLVFPNLKIKEVSMVGFDVRVELSLREGQSRALVSKFERAETVSAKPPGSVMAGAAVTGGTLFLGAPITLPMMASAHGEKIAEDLQGAIPPMIKSVMKDVADDRNLLVYARTLTSGKQPGALAESQEPLPPMSDVDTLPVV